MSIIRWFYDPGGTRVHPDHPELSKMKIFGVDWAAAWGKQVARTKAKWAETEQGLKEIGNWFMSIVRWFWTPSSAGGVPGTAHGPILMGFDLAAIWIAQVARTKAKWAETEAGLSEIGDFFMGIIRWFWTPSSAGEHGPILMGFDLAAIWIAQVGTKAKLRRKAS